MKRILKTIGTIGTMTALLVCAYLLGTTHAKTETKVKTLEKVVEVVPDGYIDATTQDFYNNYLDMRTVNGYSADGNNLQLHTIAGEGYHLEVENIQDDLQNDSMTEVYYTKTKEDNEELFEKLQHRKGKIIIQVIEGIVNDDKGNGTDSAGFYIYYDTNKFEKGDKVQSVFVFNPDNNYTDDIIYRIDTLIE